MNANILCANPELNSDTIERIDQALEFYQSRIESANLALENGWIDKAEHNRRILDARKMGKLNIICAIRWR